MLGQKDRGPSTRAALAQDDRRSQNRVPMRTTKERIRSALSEPSPASSAGEGVGEGPSCARFAAKRALQSFVQQTTLRSAGTRRRAIRNAARRKGTLTHKPLPRTIAGGGIKKKERGKRGHASIGEGRGERTGTRKRLGGQTSGASSFDPHLHPPPRQQFGEEVRKRSTKIMRLLNSLPQVVLGEGWGGGQ